MTKQVVCRLSEVHMSSQVGIEIKEGKIWNLLLLVAGSFTEHHYNAAYSLIRVSIQFIKKNAHLENTGILVEIDDRGIALVEIGLQWPCIQTHIQCAFTCMSISRTHISKIGPPEQYF